MNKLGMNIPNPENANTLQKSIKSRAYFVKIMETAHNMELSNMSANALLIVILKLLLIEIRIAPIINIEIPKYFEMVKISPKKIVAIAKTKIGVKLNNGVTLETSSIFRDL